MKSTQVINKLNILVNRLHRYQSGQIKGSPCVIFGLIQKIYQFQLRLRDWMLRRSLKQQIIQKCFASGETHTIFTIPFAIFELSMEIDLNDYEQGYLLDNYEAILAEMVADGQLEWKVQDIFANRNWGDWDGYWELAF